MYSSNKCGDAGSEEEFVPPPDDCTRLHGRSPHARPTSNAADTRAPPDKGGCPHELVLTNARVVMREAMFRGTVHLVEGRIAGIDTRGSGITSAIDLDGDFLIPGLVDIHTDNLEKHLEPRPGVAWPGFAALVSHDRAMAAAGVTTVFNSLCVGDQRRGIARRLPALVESLAAMKRAQTDGMLKSEHFLHLRCEVSAAEVVETFEELVDHPWVRLVSLMDHTPGQRQWANIAKWRQFNSGGNISAVELDAIYQRRTTLEVEVAASARREVARICHERNLVVASHDDTTAEHIADAAADGATISEFPTTALAARLARSAGMHVVMGAPNVVLGGSHSGNVSARELAAEGLVDGLASDYVPVSLIQACLLFHEAMGMAMPEAVAAVTAGPASMAGLGDRGEIAPGLRADLVWVRAYEHMPVVRGVWREGRRVV